MFRPFYNESIRKLVVAFGSLFNDIRLEHTNSGGTKQFIRVPLSYGPKEKFLRRIEESSSISDTTKVMITLPRMGFEITTIAYDPARKRNTMNRRRTNLSGATGGAMSYNYAEVPYNFDFSLYGFVRNMNDALQIIEQVLPYFTPEFTVTMNFNDINKKVDIPIILNSVNIEEDYEGEFDIRRNITTQLDFTVKSYVYGPIRKGGVILKTETTFFDFTTDDEKYLRSGPTGALSRVDVGVSGPSYGSALTGGTFTDYTTFANIYTRGASAIGPTGSTYGAWQWTQDYIDTYGNTYPSATYNPPSS
jgi:hypothetical protein